MAQPQNARDAALAVLEQLADAVGTTSAKTLADFTDGEGPVIDFLVVMIEAFAGFDVTGGHAGIAAHSVIVFHAGAKPALTIDADGERIWFTVDGNPWRPDAETEVVRSAAFSGLMLFKLARSVANSLPLVAEWRPFAAI